MIWFVPVHGAAECVVVCVDIILEIIQVVKWYSPVLKRGGKRDERNG